jgi:two-component system chemotaxis sensor kinase CheA
MASILIVEDDLLISRMYEKALGFEQYTIAVASDGEAGLAALRAAKPDLVLLDVMMPKMNGFEVLDAMKADPELKSIPVVMLTNLADAKDAETALSKGAVKYIVKGDHDPKDIVDMVKEILQAYTRHDLPKPKGEEL